MGATGSGKSTVRFLLSSFGEELPRNSLAHGFPQFINLVSGSNLGVSGGLRSCTTTVQFGVAFNLDGRRVRLIDTPGFDDTTQSDTDILAKIAAFLANS